MMKSKWPFDAIKARWPENADDPVWMTALMPSSVDRPLADRWAHNFEVVGLGSAKRAACRLFSMLQNQADTETTRRRHLATDEKTLILTHCARAAERVKSETASLVGAIQTRGVRSTLAKDYGNSVVSVFFTETVFACFEEVAQKINDGGDPLISLETVLQETRSRSAQGLNEYFSHYQKQVDSFARMCRLSGEAQFVSAAESLLRDVRAARDARELQMRIDQVHKTAPQSPPAE